MCWPSAWPWLLALLLELLPPAHRPRLTSSTKYTTVHTRKTSRPARQQQQQKHQPARPRHGSTGGRGQGQGREGHARRGMSAGSSAWLQRRRACGRRGAGGGAAGAGRGRVAREEGVWHVEKGRKKIAREGGECHVCHVFKKGAGCAPKVNHSSSRTPGFVPSNTSMLTTKTSSSTSMSKPHRHRPPRHADLHSRPPQQQAAPPRPGFACPPPPHA